MWLELIPCGCFCNIITMVAFRTTFLLILLLQQALPQNIPTLLSPNKYDPIILSQSIPKFQWTKVDNVDSYHIQVKKWDAVINNWKYVINDAVLQKLVRAKIIYDAAYLKIGIYKWRVLTICGQTTEETDWDKFEIKA